MPRTSFWASASAEPSPAKTAAGFRVSAGSGLAARSTGRLSV
ncbi:hypothetical protein [Streptomyces sp. NPDC057460]|nr:hypothetical protein OG955_01690 [Streptomyces sp. NBC_01602]